MRIDVRLGSGLSRIAGRPRLAVDVADGATVGDVLVRVAGDRPALAAGLPSVADGGARHARSEASACSPRATRWRC